jgi:hypothetical protein
MQSTNPPCCASRDPLPRRRSFQLNSSKSMAIPQRALIVEDSENDCMPVDPAPRLRLRAQRESSPRIRLLADSVALQFVHPSRTRSTKAAAPPEQIQIAPKFCFQLIRLRKEGTTTPKPRRKERNCILLRLECYVPPRKRKALANEQVSSGNTTS